MTSECHRGRSKQWMLIWYKYFAIYGMNQTELCIDPSIALRVTSRAWSILYIADNNRIITLWLLKNKRGNDWCDWGLCWNRCSSLQKYRNKKTRFILHWKRHRVSEMKWEKSTSRHMYDKQRWRWVKCRYTKGRGYSGITYVDGWVDAGG